MMHTPGQAFKQAQTRRSRCRGCQPRARRRASLQPGTPGVGSARAECSFAGSGKLMQITVTGQHRAAGPQAGRASYSRVSPTGMQGPASQWPPLPGVSMLRRATYGISRTGMYLRPDRPSRCGAVAAALAPAATQRQAGLLALQHQPSSAGARVAACSHCIRSNRSRLPEASESSLARQEHGRTRRAACPAPAPRARPSRWTR